MENNKLKNGINEIKSIVMTDSEKSCIFESILKSPIDNPKPIRSPWATFSFVAMIQSNKLVYYIVIPLIIILSSGGVVFASQDSLPDSILYPLKVNVVEKVEGALAFSPKAKAEHESSLAKKRLLEAETLAKSGKLDSINEKKINTLLSIHTASLNSALDQINTSNSPEVADSISTNFRAEMNAHARVLDILTNKEDKGQEHKVEDVAKNEDIKISNTARVSAERIKGVAGKSDKGDFKKYQDKKAEVTSLIESTDKNINSDSTTVENSNVSASIREDTSKTINEAKTYLDNADQKDREGNWKEAYSSLLDSESSVKEANILSKEREKIKHLNESAPTHQPKND